MQGGVDIATEIFHTLIFLCKQPVCCNRLSTEKESKKYFFAFRWMSLLMELCWNLSRAHNELAPKRISIFGYGSLGSAMHLGSLGYASRFDLLSPKNCIA